MLITIDDYYGIEAYNEALQALRNNGIDYKEYISVKAPFNWYIDVPNAPIMVNYDELSKDMRKYLVNKIEAATSSDEYLLQRKESKTGVQAIKSYGMNKPMLEADKSDYACFFHLKSKTQAIELSKTLGKIYYFGRYYKKFRVALCTNKMIKNMIPSEDILVQKTSTASHMEQELNFKVFRLNDRLRKFTETPSFENGNYKSVKIKQFNVNI